MARCEAALALAQAELGIIPASAAEEITRKAHLSYIDLEAVHAGLARTGHPLVPLIWELDRVCEGDAGGYVRRARPRKTSRRPGSSSRCGRRIISS